MATAPIIEVYEYKVESRTLVYWRLMVDGKPIAQAIESKSPTEAAKDLTWLGQHIPTAKAVPVEGPLPGQVGMG